MFLHRSRTRLAAAVIFVQSLLAGLAYGQSFTSEHIVISGGVGGAVGKLSASLDGSALVTIGQPFASPAVMAGGNYRMELGFWSGRLRQPGVPNFTASFEDYADKIVLNWAYDPNIPPAMDHHEAFRAGVLLKDNIAIAVSTYSDESSELSVGTSYSYSIKGYNSFGVSPMPAQTVGKTSSAGEVTGRIVTSRGSKIADASVRLTPNWGNSLFLGGDSTRVEFPFGTSYDFRNNTALPRAIVEFWVRPSSAPDHTILSDNDTWEIFVEDQSGFAKLGYRELETSPITHYVDGNLGVDVWTHISLVKDTSNGASSLQVYYGDSLVTIGGQPSVSITHAVSAASKLYVGSKGSANLFRGFIDELRTWNSARTPAEIGRDFDRYLYYRTPDSVIYPEMTGLFPMDDIASGATVTNAVNPSKSGVVFGLTGTTWSTAIKAPAYATAYTDENGEYRIAKIPYGNGTNFTLTPKKPFHIFDPTTLLVFLHEFGPVANNQNFTVTNLISISGFVEYDPDNTNGVRTGEKGVTIVVNGSPDAKQTDANGFYSVEVEPGSNVVIEPSKPSRDSLQFIPQRYEFINTVENKTANFIDRKSRDLLVSVTGGSLRLPLGPPNLVHATVKPSTGLWEKSTALDANGQFVFKSLPPQPYQLSVAIDKTVPGANRVPDLALMETYFDNNGKSFNTEDSWSTVESMWIEERDSVGLVFHSTMTAEILGFTVNPKGDFGFVQNQPDTLTFRAYEKYYSPNPDSAFRTSPLDSADFTVFDYLSDRWVPGFSKDTVKFQGDLSGSIRYGVIPGKPNISPSGDFPYQKKIEIVVTDKSGRKAGDVGWAVVLGNLPQQMDYTTVAPAIPYLILRRPPGDQSSTSFSSSQSQSTMFSMFKRETETAELGAAVNLGVKVTTIVGFGVSTELSVEAKYNLTAGLSSSFQLASSTSQVLSVSTQSSYSTGLGVGDASSFGDLDVFVGGALNLLYGVTKVLSIKTGSTDGKLYYDVSNDIMFVPDGFATTFAYTRKYIEEVLIPELEFLATEDPKKTEDVDRWKRVLAREDQLRWSAVDTSNYSFEGAAGPLMFSRTSTVSNTETFDMELDINTSIAQEVGVLINESAGASLTTKIGFGMTVGSSSSTTREVSNTVSYQLDDDDFGDDYSVNIGGDPVYGTPVFTVIAGHSSCPYEEWKNEAGEVVTIARDRAFMEWQGPSILNNVPPDDPGELRVLLRNDAQEARTYYLSVDLSTNSSGARIEVNGQIFTEPIGYTLPANEGFEAIVRVWRAPGDVYEYSDLRLMFAPECETSGGGTDGFSLPFTVNFARPCSDAVIDQPAADWVVNIGNNDTLDIIATGFDLGQSHFEVLLLQYRLVGPDTWTTVDPATILADSLRSQSAVATRMRWPVESLIDGEYEIRLSTICLNGLLTTVMQPIRGTIDRARPTVLGAAEPTDRVLNITDEIAVNFTEPINPATVRPQNVELVDGAGVGLITDLDISVSSNRLVIQPRIDPASIENHYLEAKVFGYTDVHGNGGDTVTWNFTVNRNPVSWNQPTIDVVSFVGEDNVFETTINNIGSSAEPFELRDLPTWLKASPMLGELNPGGTFRISFMIDPSLNVGDHTEFITAHTSKGDERLRVNVASMCRYPDWTVNASDYEFTMSVVARVYIKGTKSQDTYDRIGAFVDGEPRGYANVVLDPLVGDFVAYMTIYGRAFSGEAVSFRLWDRSTCREFWEADTSITFVNDGSVGSPLDPVTMNATGTVASGISLARGYTWFSVNVLNPDGGNLDSTFRTIGPGDGDRIIGQTGFAQFDAGSGLWLGPLASEGIRPGKMYVADFDSSHPLTYVGYEIAADTMELPLDAGWNWLGYLPAQNANVNTALASLTSQNLDLIKDQFSFAQYTPPFGWLGSLAKMMPGRGYKLRSAAADILTYPPPGSIIGRVSASVTDGMESPQKQQAVGAERYYQPHLYPSNMTFTAFLESDSAGYNNPEDVVLAYVGDEIRGFAMPQFVPQIGEHRIFLMVHGQADEEVTFVRIAAGTETPARLKQSVRFSPDSALGDPLQPYQLSRVKGLYEGIPEVFSLSDNFPNPFNPTTTFMIGVAAEQNVNVAVYNLLGQRVRTIVDEMKKPGFYPVVWDGRSENGASVSTGLYVVVMRSDNFRQIKKAMLLR